MRIGVLNLRLPGRRPCGVARVAHELACGLIQRGHEVTVFSADAAPAGAPYPVRLLPGAGLVRSRLGLAAAEGYLANGFAALADYSGLDVILAHGDSLLLPLRGIPVLRVMHGSAFDEARTARNVFRKVHQWGVWLQEWLTSRTQPTCAISEHTRSRYPAAIAVVPNGVDLRRFRPGDFRAAEPTLLFVGRLGGRKRGKVLLEWFDRSIRPRVPGVRLIMVSERGPAIEGVQYRANVSDDELARLYRSAWAMASPGTYEGFGLPYLEAMASGCVVIARANPGSSEVLDHGRYGRLVEDAGFADAAVELLSDSILRARFAAAGLQRARQFSLERTLDRYEDLLRAAMGAAEPAGAHA